MSRQITDRIKNTAAFKRLKTLHQQTGARDLLWHYDVGEQVHKLHPSDFRRYGTSEMTIIAEDLGRKANYADKLVKARNFYEIYNRSQVKALSQPHPDTQHVLRWYHMEALLPLQEAVREELIEKCLDQKWSTRDLRRAIDGYRTRRKRGGRKFQKPADLSTALRQLIDESSQWHRRYHEAWFPADDPAIDADAKSNRETRELASEAIEVLEFLQADIEKCLPKLKKLQKTKKARRRRKK